MKKRDKTDYRERLETSIDLALNDGQYRVMQELESFRLLSSGNGSFNAWRRDCVETLAAFGIEISEDVVRAIDAEDLVWSGEEDATRSQVDFVRSAFLAKRASADNLAYLSAYRDWSEGVSEWEMVKRLDTLAFEEFRDPTTPLTEQLGRLRELHAAGSAQDPAYSHLIDWRAFWEALDQHAEGVLRIWLPTEETIYHIAYYSKMGFVGSFHNSVRRLSSRYQWKEEEAAAFVLFDHVPSCPSHGTFWMPNADIPALSRIVLSLDPTLSPDEVREVYREERRKYTKYPMRISRKHLLAAYIAFTLDQDMTWPDRFREHFRRSGEPTLQFQDAKTFRRDAEKAYRKLMEPKFIGSEEEE